MICWAKKKGERAPTEPQPRWGCGPRMSPDVRWSWERPDQHGNVALSCHTKQNPVGTTCLLHAYAVHIKREGSPQMDRWVLLIQMLTASTPILLLWKSVTFSDNLDTSNLFSLLSTFAPAPHTWLWVPLLMSKVPTLLRWQARDHEVSGNDPTIKNHDLAQQSSIPPSPQERRLSFPLYWRLNPPSSVLWTPSPLAPLDMFFPVLYKQTSTLWGRDPF